VSPDELRNYVNEHPDAYQREIAARFNCSRVVALYALLRLEFTQKKTKIYKERGEEKRREYLKKVVKIPMKKRVNAIDTGFDAYYLSRVCMGSSRKENLR
jgi:Zn-dependent peptidase ImmA (M78 family)